MENKTAEQILYDYLGMKYSKMPIQDIIKTAGAMREYARQVAIQVRKECADKASLGTVMVSMDYQGNRPSTIIDKESILKIDIEKFLK